MQAQAERFGGGSLGPALAPGQPRGERDEQGTSVICVPCPAYLKAAKSKPRATGGEAGDRSALETAMGREGSTAAMRLRTAACLP
jgi:hypothetical protein